MSRNPNRGRVHRRCACHDNAGKQVRARCPIWPNRRHGRWAFRHRLRLHRYVGRVYVFAGVYPALVLAVTLELFWPFSAVTSISQWVLCALWGFVTTVGWVLRRRGRTADHRRWMYRSYAMTATSVIVVVVEPVVYMIITPEFSSRLAGSTDIFIQVTNSTENWLSIVIAVVVVEWYLEWDRMRRPPASRAQA